MTARRVHTILALVVVLAGCRKHPDAPVPHEETGASHFVPTTPGSPMTETELPTTAPSIAMGNLEASLADAEERLAKGTPSTAFLAVLAGIHLQHARIVGRIDEYERAAELADRAV